MPLFQQNRTSDEAATLPGVDSNADITYLQSEFIPLEFHPTVLILNTLNHNYRLFA
jgi:hypothetical protein